MSSQKRKAVIAWRVSVEAERALGFWPDDDVDAVCGSGESLFTECDRVKIFGVVIGESEGGSGISIGFIGVIFCFCGRGGIIWAGRSFVAGDFDIFFFPSPLGWG